MTPNEELPCIKRGYHSPSARTWFSIVLSAWEIAMNLYVWFDVIFSAKKNSSRFIMLSIMTFMTIS